MLVCWSAVVECSFMHICRERTQVSVQTGDVRGAGTDCDISVQLVGASGATQELRLESSANNFERNKVCAAPDVLYVDPPYTLVGQPSLIYQCIDTWDTVPVATISA
jgi:hypothetical protein